MKQTKLNALIIALMQALKKSSQNIEDVESVMILTCYNNDDNECDSQELECCSYGNFSATVRIARIESAGLTISSINDVKGEFSKVTYAYHEGNHVFIVGNIRLL